MSTSCGRTLVRDGRGGNAVRRPPQGSSSVVPAGPSETSADSLWNWDWARRRNSYERLSGRLRRSLRAASPNCATWHLEPEWGLSASRSACRKRDSPTTLPHPCPIFGFDQADRGESEQWDVEATLA